MDLAPGDVLPLAVPGFAPPAPRAARPRACRRHAAFELADGLVFPLASVPGVRARRRRARAQPPAGRGAVPPDAAAARRLARVAALPARHAPEHRRLRVLCL